MSVMNLSQWVSNVRLWETEDGLAGRACEVVKVGHRINARVVEIYLFQRPQKHSPALKTDNSRLNKAPAKQMVTLMRHALKPRRLHR